MKKILVLLFITSIAHAQVSQVEVKNFNFDYTAPRGEGTAEAFSYQKQMNEAQKVSVEKLGEDFKIVLEGVENQEIDFKNPPSLIKDAEQIKLSAFNFIFQNKVSLSMARALFQSPGKSMDLSNLSLNCDRAMAYPEVMEQVIVGCIQQMSLKTTGFSSQGEGGVDQALMKAIDLGHDELLGATTIKNVDFKLTQGKFQFSAEIKAQISGKATGSGTVNYEADGKKVTVKVSEVKFGILNVTSQVFDELKKQESPKMKVSKPYIYITLE